MISSTAMLSPDTKGSTPLWLVFWVYGVAVSHVLFGIVLWCYAHGSTLLLTSSLAVLLAYSVWISRSIWINADNVKDRRYGAIAPIDRGLVGQCLSGLRIPVLEPLER